MEELAEFEELHRKLQNIEPVARRVLKREWEKWRDDMLDKLSRFKEEDRQKIIDHLELDYALSKWINDPFIDCPECYENRLIIRGEYTGICAKCEAFFFITDCDICGKVMAGGGRWELGGYDWCEDCQDMIAYKMQHD